MASEIKVGDKFIIEVGEVDWHPVKGHHYWIKGFNTLVFDDNGISRLEKYKEPPKDTPHSCEFCVYESISADCYPCSRCDKNDDPKDMFQTKGSIIRG